IERQDKTRQDKTRQDKTRQDKTRQDKTRQDKTVFRQKISSNLVAPKKNNRIQANFSRFWAIVCLFLCT
ncbi:MAG: hypothetical protein FWG68_10480, partial [Defluviitaleaceae bacterium]|nr:hypothetical protein [Defluviitaleaceae bacterium]